MEEMGENCTQSNFLTMKLLEVNSLIFTVLVFMVCYYITLFLLKTRIGKYLLS